MIKKILEGIHHMAEGFNYLSNSEKELLARRDELELADTIQSVAILAAHLDRLDGTVELIRSADPELVMKIGSKARKITALLDGLGEKPLAPSIEISSLPVDEPVVEPQLETHADQQVEEISNDGVSAEGLGWLKKAFGPDWPLRLGVAPESSADTIATAILRLAPPRKPNSVEYSKPRIIAYLGGMPIGEIASINDGDTVAAVQQYIYSIVRRIEKLAPESIDLAPEIEEAPAEAAPIIALPVYVEPPVRQPEVETSKEVIPATHVELSNIISAKLELTGAQSMGLRSFLDPKMKSDMTVLKEDAIKKVRSEIRDKIEDPAYGLTQSEKQWIRKSFGVYFFRDMPQDRDFVPMHELAGGLRMSSQKSDIPSHIYSGLEKLFSDLNTNSSDVDSFIQAAINHDSMSDDEFHQQREILFSNLEKDGILTAEQVTALRRRSHFGEKNDHMLSDQALKDALRIIERHVIEVGGVNSGSALIDSELKKFISPIVMTSNLDALQATLPLDLQANPQNIERIIAAGIYAVYKQISQKAA